EDSYVLPADVEAISIYPHAHYLAKDMQAQATLPDGTTRWLLWIKAWDFRWQDQYRYASPVALPAGTKLSMRITYDNSADNPHNPRRPPERVKWGPKSTDEMGAMWLEVQPRRHEDAARRMPDAVREGRLAVQLKPNDDRVHFNLGTALNASRAPTEAADEFARATALNPDNADAHFNLGLLLGQRADYAGAVAHLRRAVTI